MDQKQIIEKLDELTKWLKWCEDRIYHSLVVGKRITLKAHNGQYVKTDMDNDGILKACAERPQAWEEFYVLDLGVGKIGLTGCNRKHVIVNEHDILRSANDLTPTPFYIAGTSNNRCSLRAPNNMYVMADMNTPQKVLKAVSANVKDWECFEIQVVAGESAEMTDIRSKVGKYDATLNEFKKSIEATSLQSDIRKLIEGHVSAINQACDKHRETLLKTNKESESTLSEMKKIRREIERVKSSKTNAVIKRRTIKK